MKILDRYILSSFIVNFLTVFVILFFIFILQGIWLHIQDLTGKDLDWATIAKFLLYFSPTMVPLVLPLSVLLASIMTFGSFAENYEFAAMKSSGISLNRAMRGLTLFIIGLTILSFFFANNVIPSSQFRFVSLKRDIAQVKPAMAIAEGQFSPMGNFSIKVRKKSGENGEFLDDVIIHKRNEMLLSTTTIVAKKGILKGSKNSNLLQLVLIDGHYYEDIIPNEAQERNKIPFAKSNFKKYIITIDLSGMNKSIGDNAHSADTYMLMNVTELKITIDSLKHKQQVDLFSFRANAAVRTDDFFRNNNPIPITDTTVVKKVKAPEDLLSIINANQKKTILESTKNYVSNNQFALDISQFDLENKQKNINVHWVFLYEKFVIAYSCLLMFFIGAPLGAIIRKGGLGLPIVFAVIIFLAFHFLNLFGKKVAQENGMPPLLGSWLSSLVLTPLALFVTYRATNDQDISINFDWLTKWFTFFKPKNTNSNA